MTNINRRTVQQDAPYALPGPIVPHPNARQSALPLIVKQPHHPVNEGKRPLVIGQPVQADPRRIHYFQIVMVQSEVRVARENFGIVVLEAVDGPAEIDFEFSLGVHHHAQGGGGGDAVGFGVDVDVGEAVDDFGG